VEVRRPTRGETDALGNPARGWTEPEEVADVYASPGATADAVESNRPDGARVAWTLTFPDTYTASLRGCQVRVPGDSSWYDVAGDPQKVPQQFAARMRHDRVAEAVASDG